MNFLWFLEGMLCSSWFYFRLSKESLINLLVKKERKYKFNNKKDVYKYN